jgi:hypothetical protein
MSAREAADAKKSIQDPTLVVELKTLVEPMTRGDPRPLLLWTPRSLRNLANELANKEHKVCPTVVGDLLRGMGAIACRRTARHEKAAGSSIGTRNFNTSIRRPRHFWRRPNGREWHRRKA